MSLVFLALSENLDDLVEQGGNFAESSEVILVLLGCVEGRETNHLSNNQMKAEELVDGHVEGLEAIAFNPQPQALHHDLLAYLVLL